MLACDRATCQRERMGRPVRAVGAVPADVAAELAWAGGLDTLEDVLARRLAIVEVIVQDEYTHDVVTTHAGVHLVFDTT